MVRSSTQHSTRSAVSCLSVLPLKDVRKNGDVHQFQTGQGTMFPFTVRTQTPRRIIGAPGLRLVVRLILLAVER